MTTIPRSPGIDAIIAGIIGDQAFDRCAVLADALADAGYDDDASLAILRSGRGLRAFEFADWLSKTAMPSEIAGYDWLYAFGAAGEPGGTLSEQLSPALPGSDISLAPFRRIDVTDVLAVSDGENEGPNWLCFGRLRDGRCFFLSAGCDYTGWGCRDWGSCQLGTTASEVWRYAMGDEDRERLALLPYKPDGPQELAGL